MQLVRSISLWIDRVIGRCCHQSVEKAKLDGQCKDNRFGVRRFHFGDISCHQARNVPFQGLDTLDAIHKGLGRNRCAVSEGQVVTQRKRVGQTIGTNLWQVSGKTWLNVNASDLNLQQSLAGILENFPGVVVIGTGVIKTACRIGIPDDDSVSSGSLRGTPAESSERYKRDCNGQS